MLSCSPGSRDALALQLGAPVDTADAFITVPHSQATEGCTGSFLRPKIGALHGNGYAFCSSPHQDCKDGISHAWTDCLSWALLGTSLQEGDFPPEE